MKKSRRDLLKMGAMAGAGMVLPTMAPAQTVNTRVHTNGGVTFHGHVSRPAHTATSGRAGSLNLAQFVDQLPIMPGLRPSA
jgi:hypothetical protein